MSKHEQTILEYALNLQNHAAGLARIAREYAGLGPAWQLSACTMQRAANNHYAMAREAMDYVMRRRTLREQAAIVGRSLHTTGVSVNEW